MGPLHELWEKHASVVQFVVVYIREAHPEDGWVVTMNREQGIALNDPTTNAERENVAEACALRLEIRTPFCSYSCLPGSASPLQRSTLISITRPNVPAADSALRLPLSPNGLR